MGRKWRWVAAITALVLGIASVAYADYYNGYRTVALMLDGRAVSSDVPAIIMDGRTLLPVRALTEAMGHDVQWDPNTYTVSLTTQPRLDAVKGPTGLQMSMLGFRQQSSQETGNDSLAGRLVNTVRIVNRGDGDQEVDLSRIQMEGQAGDDPRTRTVIAPTVLETSGSKKPAPGTTTVVLARGEEITAVLGYDIAANDGGAARTYRMVMTNSAGEPQMAMRIRITITIDCSHRPCTITITIRF